MTTKMRLPMIAIVPAATALNVTVGVIVNLLKLPVYLDAVGTVLTVLVLYPLGRSALVAGMITGVASFVIAGVLFNPVLFWFTPTQAVIAIYSYVVLAPVLQKTRERTFGRRASYTVLAGIGLGLVCAVVNAPIVVYVFGGVTGSGPSLIAAAFLKMGENVWQATMSFGLTSEPVDKALQCLAALIVFERLRESGIAVDQGK